MNRGYLQKLNENESDWMVQNSLSVTG